MFTTRVSKVVMHVLAGKVSGLYPTSPKAALRHTLTSLSLSRRGEGVDHSFSHVLHF